MENEHNDPETGTQATDSGDSYPDMTFETLPETMRAACERAGWDTLMPVQQKALPYLLDDRDVMVQARTGSGKTGAYVLPLLEKLDPSDHRCQALVMVPTRELAKQVAQDARTLAGDDGIKVVAVYGGVGYKEQLDAFRDGTQIVVGTPGRVLDHLVRRNLHFDGLKAVIFDEADRMLSVGFYPDMVEVKRYLPKTLRGVFMFSATFPPSVLRLAEEFMVKPEFLSLSSEETNVSAIAHQFVEVPAMGKERKLIKLIELENPSSAIIFSNTKRNVEFTAALLSQFGFDAEGLTSDLSQNKRERLMARIKAGDLRFLVATDVAARGIDIPELSHVFMMEPPEDPESYVHRAGRTGRAGATGTAITLVDVIQKMELERIATRFNIHFEELKDPTDEDVIAIIEERLTAILEKDYRKLTNIQKERVSRFIPLVRKYAAEDDATALLAMLLDEIYQPTLHGKPAAPDTVPAPQPARARSDSNPRRERKPRQDRDQSSRRRQPRDDRGRQDQPRYEESGQKEPRQDESRPQESRPEESRQTESRQSEPRQDESRQSEPRQGRSRRRKPRQDRPREEQAREDAPLEENSRDNAPEELPREEKVREEKPRKKQSQGKPRREQAKQMSDEKQDRPARKRPPRERKPKDRPSEDLSAEETSPREDAPVRESIFMDSATDSQLPDVAPTSKPRPRRRRRRRKPSGN